MYETISLNTSEIYFKKFFKFKKIKLRYDFGKITITQTHILNYTLTLSDTHNDTHTHYDSYRSIQSHTYNDTNTHNDKFTRTMTYNDTQNTHTYTHTW